MISRTLKLGWAAALLGVALATQAATYNVRDYGAKADKTTNDAPAIQAAIDACNRAGGGEVIVPSGNYLIGRLALKSNVALDLQDGCNLWASSRWEDYRWEEYQRSNPARQASRVGRARSDVPHQQNAYLITADGQDNVTVKGTGQIHGLGQGDLDRRTDGNPGSVYMGSRVPRRYGTMEFSRCRDVHISDIEIRYSERYSISLSRCERVFIDGVSILNNYWRTNTDGIDPGSCKDVFISNCYIVAGDDCIALNTSSGQPVENVVVTNCVLQSVSTAIKLGTGTRGDFRHIRVSNCVIRNTGIGVGLYMKDGGSAEDLGFDNISIETTTLDTEVGHGLRISYCPIYIDIEKATDQSPISTVRDVSFSNIQVTSDYSIVIQGMTQSPVHNLTLRNITLRVPRGYDFSERRKPNGGRGNPHDDRITKYVRQPAYLALANIDGLEVDDIRVLMSDDIFRQYPRSAVGVYDSRDGVIRDVGRRPAGGPDAPPMVVLENCQDVRVVPNR